MPWTGLAELREALRQLPAALTGEASRIVEGTANAAIVDMRAEYPPGELRDKLFQSTQAEGPFGVSIRLRNASGWAWHWDHGTQMRHWINGKSTGQMQPHHTFGRTMTQSRRRMYAQLQQLLERTGLRVSGEP